jgi:hypothetical protein
VFEEKTAWGGEPPAWGKNAVPELIHIVGFRNDNCKRSERWTDIVSRSRLDHSLFYFGAYAIDASTLEILVII